MIKNLAHQLMFTMLGSSLLLGGDLTLNVADQEVAVRLIIPIEENLSDIEEYWATIPEFLESLQSVSGAERESVRTILNTGFPVEIDLRYEDEGLPYSFRFWIKDGRIVRSFVRTTVTEAAFGLDLARVQEKIEGIMEERFREVRKQSDEAAEDLQRRATEQRKMIEEMESRSPGDSNRPIHPDQR